MHIRRNIEVQINGVTMPSKLEVVEKALESRNNVSWDSLHVKVRGSRKQIFCNMVGIP